VANAIHSSPMTTLRGGAEAGNAAPVAGEAQVWRPSGLFRNGVFLIDRLLRRYYGIHEFSRTPDDLLRIAVGIAHESISLPDGTEIAPGDPVIDLHLWNERFLALGSCRVGLGWGCRVRRRVMRSLAALAAHVAADPSLAGCKALRADAAFVSRRKSHTLSRIARRLGFTQPTRLQPADPGHTMLALALAWAFGPASARLRPRRAMRCTFWMSRRALCDRYGTGSARPPSGWR
jgi:hypothetical protein